MKNLLYVGVTLLIVNTLFGLLLSSYSTFNVCLNSITIIATALVIWSLYRIRLHEGYRVSLMCIWIAIGVISFIIGFFSENKLVDNWVVITDAILYSMGALLTIIANRITLAINKKQ